MLFQCWSTVFDAGPALKQHWVNASGSLGIMTLIWSLLLYLPLFRLQSTSPSSDSTLCIKQPYIMAAEFLHRQDSVGPQIIERDGVRMLQLITQLEGFRYSDLLVRPQEDKILVMDSSEKVLKSYPLPESVDPYTVEADISDEGVLTVLAPLKG